MFNNKSGRFGDENFNKNSKDPANFINSIAELLMSDGIADISLGTMLEGKHNLGSCKSATARLPELNRAPVGIDDFTRQIKLAIEDCFNGTVVNNGLGSICYILPDKTAFNIQIAKL
jgi:hypothetical protein